ncbi:FixH family protein [Azospirillum sp.]|uniref:FixH family protein n=1 Tax=Azospirillum sp. TaxID=34012 RepID=UPI003D7355A0
MSMTTDAANRVSRPGPRPGWYIPFIFFAFFGVVIAVNGAMIYFATSTFNGLETEDHFVKGIKYNQDIAGAKAQAERGWKVDLAFVSPEPGKGKVTLNLHDKHGNLLKDAKVRMKFIRPTMQGYDRTITPEYAGDGRYVAALDLPLPGIWDVRLVIEHATGDYQDQQRVFVQ